MYKRLNSKQRDVMLQLLLMANHSGKDWEWKGEIYTCAPGQLVTSLESITQKCANDVKVQSVRTALLVLGKWQFLTNESTKTGRLITIVNWAKYQGEDTQANNEPNKELTKSQQRANKELTTNKNVKKEKNDKNDKNIESVRAIEKVDNQFISELQAQYPSLKVNEIWENLQDWCKAKGKSYKDYQAALRNWVRRENEGGSMSTGSTGGKKGVMRLE